MCIPCQVNQRIFITCSFVPQPNKVNEDPIANEPSKRNLEKVSSSTKTKQKTANKSKACYKSTAKSTQNEVNENQITNEPSQKKFEKVLSTNTKHKTANKSQATSTKRGKKRKSPIKRAEGKRPSKRPQW